MENLDTLLDKRPIIPEFACSVCTKIATAKCGKCGIPRYCSKECQRAQWPRHKQTCTDNEAARQVIAHVILPLFAAPALLDSLVALHAKTGYAFVVGPGGNDVYMQRMGVRAPCNEMLIIAPLEEKKNAEWLHLYFPYSRNGEVLYLIYAIRKGECHGVSLDKNLPLDTNCIFFLHDIGRSDVIYGSGEVLKARRIETQCIKAFAMLMMALSK